MPARSSLLLVLAVLGSTACVSNPNTVRHEHHVDGVITLDAENYRIRHYDPSDARLVRSLREIEAVMGRPLVVRFNVDTMPRVGAFFEYFFESELGRLPQRLRAWKHSYPNEFDAMLAELRHIDFDYDGSLDGPKVELGPPPERLRIVLDSWNLGDEVLNRALSRYHTRYVARRYLDVAPDAVPAGERLAYAEALLRDGAAHFGGIEWKLPENQEPAAGRSEVTLRLLRLEAVAGSSDPKLREVLTRGLLDAGSYLRECYRSSPKFLAKVREPSRFLRAEKEWMRWALGALDRLPPEPRYELFDLMLVRGTRSSGMLDERAFPGFDLASRGLVLFDEWARAGYPTAAGTSEPSPDPKVRLFDRLLCPTTANARGFRTLRARNCSPSFYSSSLTTAENRSRLLEKAVATPDRTLFREIALNLLNQTSSYVDSPKGAAVTAVLELWRKLEPNAELFRELSRLMAIEIDVSTELREALYDQTTLYYRARPADRGVLLFLLSRIDGHGRTSVNWKSFTEVYGAPISDRELDTYLDQSYLAFLEFKNLAPALSGSPGKVLAPKISRFLDDPGLREQPSTRGIVLGAIASTLSQLGDLAGLAALRVEVERYVGTDPGRERQFRDALASLRSRTEAAETSTSPRR
jgi:hypothetical protein